MSTLVSNLFDIINLLGIASSIEINSGTVCRFHQQTGVGSGEFPFNQPVTGPRLTTTLTLLPLPVKGGLALLLVPLVAHWLDMSYWHAFITDLGLLMFFLVYTMVFTWAFDRVFGLPVV